MGQQPDSRSQILAGEGVSPREMLAEILAAVAEASSSAVLVVAADGSVLSHNERFATTFGVVAATVDSGSLQEVALALRENGIEVIASLLTEPGSEDRGEVVVPDGRAFTWRSVTVAGDRATVWVFQDVTPRRQLVMALHDAGNWLRMIETHMTNVVVVELDEDARFVSIFANSGAFFAKPDASLEGEGIAVAIGEHHGLELDSRVRRVLSTGVPDTFEYVIERDGKRRVFIANTAAMASDEGEPAHATLMIRDVTDFARMQAQMLETEKLASVGLLAAGVAHEINNPIAYTLLNLEQLQSGLRSLLRRSLAAEDGHSSSGRSAVSIDSLLDAVRMCLEGCQRVQSIVQDLRRFSRSDHDENRVPIDVRRVLDFAIDMAAPEARRRASIVRKFGDTPYVLASEGRLSQVFLNLIVNAMQAIPEGAPHEHEIRLVTSTDACGRAVIEVSDTGEGMTPAVMEHIFEPFYTTKAAGVGTGLGLSICHGIATSMGGEISVESVRGRGSIFRLLLPAAEAM